MSVLKRPGIALPGYRRRARTAVPSDCKGIWDLMGGDASRAVKNLVSGGPTLSVNGAPIWNRWGAVLSADNWLDTNVGTGNSQVTLAVVAQRAERCVYIGNFGGGSVPSDNIIDLDGGSTILRYFTTEAIDVEIDHGVAVGDFMLVVGQFWQYARGHAFAAGDVEVVSETGPGTRDHTDDSQTYRLGRGYTAYTTDTVLICAAAIWHTVLSDDQVATEVAPMFAGMTRRHGLHIARAA